jgi:hypothetical protein
VAGKLVRLVPGEAAAHLVRVPELQGADPLLVGAVGGQLYLDGSDGSLGSRLYRARASGAITGSLHRPTDQLLPLVVDDSGLWFSSNGTDMVLVADPRSMRITGTGILTTGEVVPDPTMSLDELWLPDADATAVVKIDPAEFLRRVG